MKLFPKKHLSKAYLRHAKTLELSIYLALYPVVEVSALEDDGASSFADVITRSNPWCRM